MFDNKLVEWLSREFHISPKQARDVIAAIDNHPDFTINRRVGAPPRKLRCKQCKLVKPNDEIGDKGVCTKCASRPNPDDRTPSRSVRTVSGGLPTLGKGR